VPGKSRKRLGENDVSGEGRKSVEKVPGKFLSSQGYEEKTLYYSFELKSLTNGWKVIILNPIRQKNRSRYDQRRYFELLEKKEN
jgi:hypothetical protein